MFKKALVPLDLSELAECVLAYVKKLAKDRTLSEVILLNVAEVDPAWDQMGAGFDVNTFRNAIKNKSERYLADVHYQLSSAGINVKTESIEGTAPAQVITDYAQKNGVDVIIISSHGYTGIKKLVFGSVAMGVLHLSHAPVLLLRPESCRI